MKRIALHAEMKSPGRLSVNPTDYARFVIVDGGRARSRSDTLPPSWFKLQPIYLNIRWEILSSKSAINIE